MKRIIALALCLITVFSFVSCGCVKEEEVVEAIKVTGNIYKVDLETVNIAWEDGNEPTQYEKDTFLSSVKAWYEGSEITFSDESSFSLSGTNNGTYDFYAESCERIDNELYKELRLRGNVDVVIYEDKVSFLCDFFLKGWGMYLSIDYKLSK